MGGFAGRLGGAEPGLARRLGRPLDARGPAARWEGVGDDASAVVVDSGLPGATSPVGQAHGVFAAVQGAVPNLRALAAEQDLEPEAGAGVVLATLIARTGFARALARLPGDVALAAWEPAARRGWLARDRAGLRPLAWAEAPGGVVFATEARALALAGFAGGPDPRAVAALVALGALGPPRAVPAGARALAPGQVLEVQGGRAHATAAPAAPRSARGERGNVERWSRSARYGLELAWGWRSRGAGPAALALGGGLASAALVALRPREGGPQVALTLRLPWGVEPGAAELAAAAGLRLVEVRFDAEVLAELLDEVAPAAAWVRPEAWAWAALARAAWREGCTALSTGVGARHGFDPPQPGPLGGRGARLLGRLAPRSPAVELAARLGGFVPGEEALLAGLPEAEADAEPAEAAAWLGRSLALPEHELAAVDAGAASFGLAHLAPFADPAVLAVACEVPAAAHHATGRRSLLAGLGGRAPAAPREWPCFDAALLAPLELDTLAGRLDGLLDGEHVRAVVAAARQGQDASVRRAFALAMVARGLVG